jgi:hypothetical protein
MFSQELSAKIDYYELKLFAASFFAVEIGRTLFQLPRKRAARTGARKPNLYCRPEKEVPV